MSTPIRPPGTTPSAALEPTDAVEAGQPAEAAREASAVQPEAEASEVRHPLAAELESGRMDADAALDALVDRASNSVDAGQMSAADREYLVQMLQSAVRSDPTLVALARSLGRTSTRE